MYQAKALNGSLGPGSRMKGPMSFYDTKYLAY